MFAAAIGNLFRKIFATTAQLPEAKAQGENKQFYTPEPVLSATKRVFRGKNVFSERGPTEYESLIQMTAKIEAKMNSLVSGKIREIEGNKGPDADNAYMASASHNVTKMISSTEDGMEITFEHAGTKSLDGFIKSEHFDPNKIATKMKGLAEDSRQTVKDQFHERTLSIAEQCADGLAFVHTSGVVHRDIKAENFVANELPPAANDRGETDRESSDAVNIVDVAIKVVDLGVGFSIGNKDADENAERLKNIAQTALSTRCYCTSQEQFELMARIEELKLPTAPTEDNRKALQDAKNEILRDLAAITVPATDVYGFAIMSPSIFFGNVGNDTLMKWSSFRNTDVALRSQLSAQDYCTRNKKKWIRPGETPGDYRVALKAREKIYQSADNIIEGLNGKMPQELRYSA
jgi:serine/threonine protein kinase